MDNSSICPLQADREACFSVFFFYSLFDEYFVYPENRRLFALHTIGKFNTITVILYISKDSDQE
jgi:hypothetical protein